MTTYRLLLTSLAAAVAVTLTGCDKISSLSPFKKKEAEPAVETTTETQPAAATPADAATTAAALPETAPTPQKEEINRNAGVIVLCYHRFVEKNPDNLALTPEEFRRQLQVLKDNGITVIGMQDFLAWRRGEKNIPDKSCVITIDDGYVSAYTMAWPILKEFDYPFTMFVYMDYISIGGQSISWDQLAHMRDEGVDIQSHTWSHQSLRGTGRLVNKKNQAEIKEMGYEGWLAREIEGSKTALEERLGIRVNTLAYPYGLHNEASRAMVLKSGYDAAFTVYGQRNGIDHPSADQIGRYAIGSKEPEIFEAALRAINSGASAASGPSAPSVTQLAAASMLTKPMDGETITEPLPTILANLATMGNVEEGSAEMRISGVGVVPATYDAASKNLSYTFDNRVPALRPGSYTVIINARVDGKRVETRWSFTFANP